MSKIQLNKNQKEVLFIVAMLQTVILGLYTVLSPMIQALFQNRKAIRYFLYPSLIRALPSY